MVDTKKERCEFCRWFAPEPLEPDKGACVIEPPKSISIPANGGFQTFGVFPPVQSRQRCSKFERDDDNEEQVQ